MNESNHRPSADEPQRRILIFVDAYLPGWRAGGPTRSIANLVETLGDTHDLYVFTRDHDHGDSHPYPGVTPDRWLRVGKSHVFYASKSSITMRAIGSVVEDLSPDLVYLNSVLSRLTIRYLTARRLHRVEAPVLLAPRGEFSDGALGIKPGRKRTYLSTARATGLFDAVHWQASSPHEAADIRRSLKPDVILHTVGNPAAKPLPDPLPAPPKSVGSVSFVSVARLSRMKNLPFLVDRIQRSDGDVSLRLIGRRDDGYWPDVESTLKTLSPNIVASWQNGIPPAEVEGVLATSHFFTLPTLGENFGHAIYEALRAGRPVVISDRTPWRDLEASGAGWDIPLEEPERWHTVLQQCVDMNREDYLTMSRAAHALARRWFDASGTAEAYAAMFEETIGRSP